MWIVAVGADVDDGVCEKNLDGVGVGDYADCVRELGFPTV